MYSPSSDEDPGDRHPPADRWAGLAALVRLIGVGPRWLWVPSVWLVLACLSRAWTIWKDEPGRVASGA
jgi:hypothetical protein